MRWNQEFYYFNYLSIHSSIGMDIIEVDRNNIISKSDILAGLTGHLYFLELFTYFFLQLFHKMHN